MVEQKTSQNLVYLESRRFPETFQEFCFSSLYIKQESIVALLEAKKACDQIEKMSFFNFGNSSRKVQKLSEFKTIQESSISLMIKHLKITWINDLTEIIQKNFKNVGQGWFNMKETNKLTYDFGKLKRFLTFVRLMMQNSL